MLPRSSPLEALEVGANLERLRLWSSRHFAKALLQTAFKKTVHFDFDLILDKKGQVDWDAPNLLITKGKF